MKEQAERGNKKGDASAVASAPPRFSTEESAWIFLEEVDSTNSYLARENHPSGTLVLAQRQTAGRGRGKRSWKAKESAGFIFSGVLSFSRDMLDRGKLTLLPLLAGIATLAAARRARLLYSTRTPSPEFFIKWPNDVYLVDPVASSGESAGSSEKPVGSSGKSAGSSGKLAGVLVESTAAEKEVRAIIGIGLNWKHPGGPAEDYSVSPAALFADEEDVPEPRALTPLLVEEFNRRVPELFLAEEAGFLAEIREVLYGRGSLAQAAGEEVRVLELNSDGGLLVRNSASGEKKVLHDVPADWKVL